MTVDPHTAKHRADYRGHTYYFCSASCRTKFVADPQKYLGRARARAGDPKARSTPARCIRRSGRSAPAPARSAAWRSNRRIATADTGPNPELVDMTRRFWIGLVLTLPVFVLEMGAHLVGAHGWVDPSVIELYPVRLRDAGGAVGRAGRSSCAAGSRSSRAISTCSR